MAYGPYRRHLTGKLIDKNDRQDKNDRLQLFYTLLKPRYHGSSYPVIVNHQVCVQGNVHERQIL